MIAREHAARLESCCKAKGLDATWLPDVSPKLLLVHLDASAQEVSSGNLDCAGIHGISFACDEAFFPSGIMVLGRGVPLFALPRVLRDGIDVIPASAPFWSERGADKALEQGGAPKVVLLYDPDQCEPSILELPADIGPDERDALLRDYPTIVKEPKSGKTWVSRFPPKQRYYSATQEEYFGYWIPGDARMALLAAAVITSRDTRERTIAYLKDGKFDRSTFDDYSSFFFFPIED